MSFLTSFLSTLLVILWLPIIGIGTLYFLPVYRYPGFFGWLLLNFGLAVFWNQARKAQHPEYDDRLSDKRMEEARNWLYRRWKQK